MSTAENPRAVIGANLPPDPLLIEASERIDNANRWLAERSDWKAWDAAVADKAQFFLNQIAATYKALDERRLDEGRAFKAAQDKVYRDPLALLTTAKAKLEPLKVAWLKREDDRVQAERARVAAEAEAKRKAAEEAERKAQEAETQKGADTIRASHEAEKAWQEAEEAKAAVEAAPERAVIKGSYTTTAKGLRDFWSAEIVDISEAFRFYNKKSNPHRGRLEAAIRDAIQSIADGEARLLKDESKAAPGIRFVKDRR